MKNQTRNSTLGANWMTVQEATVCRLAAAARHVQEAKTPVSEEELRSAVDAARNAGVVWTRIGDTLGIASGNAYQRYRKRPGS